VVGTILFHDKDGSVTEQKIVDGKRVLINEK